MRFIIGDENLADDVIYCTNCGAEINYEEGTYIGNKFCPNCGAGLEIKVVGE